MVIRDFEDILAWQNAREVVKDIYSLVNEGEFKKDFSLRDQIVRSGISIMANIAEGFESQSDEEFSRFLFYAKRSAAETISHLYIARDQDYITEKDFRGIKEKLNMTNKMINKLISYLKKSKKK